jgi:hypothetical protein
MSWNMELPVHSLVTQSRHVGAEKGSLYIRRQSPWEADIPFFGPDISRPQQNKGPLLCSQETITGSSSESDESNPHSPILFRVHPHTIIQCSNSDWFNTLKPDRDRKREDEVGVVVRNTIRSLKAPRQYTLILPVGVCLRECNAFLIEQRKVLLYLNNVYNLDSYRTGNQKTPRISITNTNWLTLFRETIAVYSKKCMKHTTLLRVLQKGIFS